MTREQFIADMRKVSPYSGSFYYELKNCIITKSDKDDIDRWFQGIINSLYYHPNPYLLVLIGKDGIGKSHFLANLCPPEYYYLKTESHINAIYEYLIIDIDIFGRDLLGIASEANFRVINGTADKRLASYATTDSKWRYPPRKTHIVLQVDHFDQYKFNAIPKQLLWQDIYHIFKPNRNERVY